jgi:DNA-directed RNA polymerase specialized sigma24 family protein
MVQPLNIALFNEYLPLAKTMGCWFVRQRGDRAHKIGGPEEIHQVALVALFEAALAFPEFSQRKPDAIFKPYAYVVIRNALFQLSRCYKRWKPEQAFGEYDQYASTEPNIEDRVIAKEEEISRRRKLQATCPECWTVFDLVTKQQRFCSARCTTKFHNSANEAKRSAERAALRAGKQCVRCGQGLETKRSDTLYCGWVCRNKAALNNTVKVQESRARGREQRAIQEQRRQAVLRLAKTKLSTRDIAAKTGVSKSQVAVILSEVLGPRSPGRRQSTPAPIWIAEAAE